MEKLDVKALRLAAAKAESIGVSVEIRGSIPVEESLRGILSDAILECAANTVKHAEGDHLTVEIAEKDGRTRIEITNNGRPPKGEIAESGGLLALRRTVEEWGGEMVIQSGPVFSLLMVL